MNRVKKISIVFVIMMLIICMFTSKTYAALNCNVNLSASKNKVTYKEQFSVYVAISNLQTTKGIIAIGAVVSYDTDSLTLVSIEGQNKWSDPFHNPSNGKITSFKNEVSTKNENVFKITFKVNEKGKAKKSAWVKISNFEISDGEGEKNCGGNSINIAIEEKNSGSSGSNNQGSNNTQKPGNTTNNTKPGNSNQNTQTTKPNTETTKPSSSGSNNVQGGNAKNETTKNTINNVEENSIGNVAENNVTNSESQINNVQNAFDSNTEETKEDKTMSKGLFYTISIVSVIAIIGILFAITKYWKIH